MSMDISLLTRTRDQLKLAKDILAMTWESGNPSLDGERINIALERIALVEESFLTICDEVMQLQSQHDNLRRATGAGVGLEVRPGAASQGGQEHAVSSAPKRNLGATVVEHTKIRGLRVSR